MTTRLAMAVSLLLVLLAQAFGLVSVLRDDPLRNLVAKGKKETQAAMPPGMQSLQPTLPYTPPDLNQGYLFNAERSLAALGDGKEAGNEAMDKVRYNGSIISENDPRALLSYPLANPGPSQKQGFLRIVVGDTVNGYMVTEIMPEKVIFSRGGQKITKLLYDRTREQAAGQPSTSASEPRVQTPIVSQSQQAPTQNNTSRILSPSRPTSSPQSDEELRNNPLRKRQEPQKETQASEAAVLVPGGSREPVPAQPKTVQK